MNDRMELIHALTRAANAFYRSLEESGYRVTQGAIYRNDDTFPAWHIGMVNISWTFPKRAEEK